MLKVQSNSRQIPDNEVYTADKRYNDLLYGYLQEISYFDAETSNRYINKSDINFARLAGHLKKKSRQTASVRFKHLLELGLIEYEEDKKRYKLCLIEKSLCSLVPFETLRILNNALSDYSISLYVYLLKRFIANQEQPFVAYMKQMKGFIGISTTTTSNNDTVTDILRVLQACGLIEYELQYSGEDNKKYYNITQVNNVIKADKTKSEVKMLKN